MVDKRSVCLWVYRAAVVALLLAVLRALSVVSGSIGDCSSACEAIKEDFRKFASPRGFAGLESLATDSDVGYLRDDVKKISERLDGLGSDVGYLRDDVKKISERLDGLGKDVTSFRSAWSLDSDSIVLSSLARGVSDIDKNVSNLRLSVSDLAVSVSLLQWKK